jgi:preprotein translocase subunit SecG
LAPFLSLTQIIISIALIVLILLQTKGSGMGSLFGGSDSNVYKSRRGVEKTMFNVTIGLSLAFFIVAILNVISAG